MRYLFLLLFTSLCFAQEIQNVDFKTLTADIEIDQFDKSVSGKVTCEFDVKDAINTIKIDAVNMKFDKVFVNKKEIKFVADDKQLTFIEGVKKGKNIFKNFGIF